MIFSNFFLSKNNKKSCRIGFLQRWGLERVVCKGGTDHQAEQSFWWCEVATHVIFFLQVNVGEEQNH